MDPVVSLVVSALVEGTKAGLSGAATTLVTETLQKLKGLVVGLLRRGGTAEEAGQSLVEQATDPAKEQHATLVAELTRTGVDDPTHQAAQELLNLLRKAAKFNVDASHAQGVQIGDHGTQTIHFH
ncbi:hypothetical protein ACFQZ4_05645 [Catellatospora coxensis]|uniref:Uncharacterized protein n=1 Tax=Catellatospora coxensis TaxID=310354 RepID=A0A8J3KXZ0_9ACTN|nr:hypothetical protein [Catellatospora coxensis]GIG05424.1 hypothetical protein Cco03nite_21240 [Catellatospora coxensis]